MSKSSTNPDQRKLINLYFQVHQPRRVKPFQFFDIGTGKSYFDDAMNGEIVRRVASECYLPANRMLLDLIRKHPAIRITFSISGTAIDQFRQYAPAVIHSFRQLAETGAVEFLAETYYHSLASVWNQDEFAQQVDKHRQATEEFFGCRPAMFRNTELIFNDEIADTVKELGFRGIFVEGTPSILGDARADQLFRHAGTGLAIFARDYRLSDDIAFRFSDVTWDEWPLTPEKFFSWLLPDGPGQLTCLGMDYETFGEHHKEKNGILHFLETVLTLLADSPEHQMVNPEEAVDLITPSTSLSSEESTSWADQAKDLSAWLGNEMQKDAFDSLNQLLPAVLETGSRHLLNDHRYLQTSDHYYYMCTKRDVDGAVHSYFSPHRSPYEAFMTFMNIVSDIEFRIRQLRSVGRVQRKSRRPQLPVLEY